LAILYSYWILTLYPLTFLLFPIEIKNALVCRGIQKEQLSEE